MSKFAASTVLALSSLIAIPFASAGEPVIVQSFSVRDSRVQLVDCSTCDRGPGTLFRWSDCPCEAGGPDLDAPLVTDRPDFTEASSTVGVGVVQVEFGYTYTQNDDAGTRTENHSVGEPLFRIGLHEDWLELRIASGAQGQETTVAGVSNWQSNINNLYLGFKIGLTPQCGWLPEMALIPQMEIPVGRTPFNNGRGRAEPGVNLIYGWELTEEIATAGQTQVNRRFDDNANSFTEISQSWTVAYSLTDKIGAYTEWFGIFSSGAQAGGDTEHYFNGGFTYLLSNDVQWDIRAGVGLNDNSDDMFVGTGLSIRYQ